MAEEIKRNYTIPLRRGYANTPRYKRTHKAIRVLKAFLIQHFKTEDIKLGKELNEFMWRHGIKNPPSRVKVTAVQDKDGVVKVELEGKEYVEFKVKEKTEKNQSFQEKLKGKVAAAKDAPEEAPKTTSTPTTEKQPAVKAAEKQTPVKAPSKVAEKPKVNPKPKAEAKPKADKPAAKKPTTEKKAE